jgi:hypothetical protein
VVSDGISDLCGLDVHAARERFREMLGVDRVDDSYFMRKLPDF